MVCSTFIFQCSETRTASRASASTPTCGPNSRTAANAPASDTDTRVSIDGTFTVSMPLPSVRIVKSTHSGGMFEWINTTVLFTTIGTPTRLTMAMKSRAETGSDPA